MPELPEVETVCNALKNRAESRIIKEFKIYNPNLRWVINRKIPDKTANQKINLIKRRGKYLLLESSNENLIIHLGMSGSLRIAREDNLKKHDHIDICFEDGTILRYCDPRRFGCFLWSKDCRTTPCAGNHWLMKAPIFHTIMQRTCACGRDLQATVDSALPYICEAAGSVPFELNMHF